MFRLGEIREEWPEHRLLGLAGHSPDKGLRVLTMAFNFEGLMGFTRNSDTLNCSA